MLSDKPVPINIEIERFVAGSLLLMEQPDIEKYSSLLEADDFTNTFCFNVCKTVRNLVKNKIGVDFVTVAASINQTDELIRLTDEIPTTAGIEDKIKILKLFTAQRKSIFHALGFIENIYDTDNVSMMINKLINDLEKTISTSSILNGVMNAAKAQEVFVKDGVSSGFVTWDYNDSGLRERCLTLLLGSKNHGKTTIARLILLAASMQNVKSMFFCGETSLTEEKRIFSKMCGSEQELQCMENLGGREVWYPRKSAFMKFNEIHAKNIAFIDDSALDEHDKLFDYVYRNMEEQARAGAKIYVLDSMTILAEGDGNKVFSHQKEIIKRLNSFKKKYNAHIILIVHPKKGKGWESSSGVGEIEALADTIVRYIRMTDDDHLIETQNYKNKTKVLANVNLPEEEKKNISAMITTEKIRLGGTKHTLFLKYDSHKEIVKEVSLLPKAKEYEAGGFWVKAIHRYSEEDMPDYDKQYSA